MDRFRLFPSGELGMHPTGEWTSYADAQRALDAERARVKELQGAASTPINELLAELISCAGVFDVSTDYEDDRKALETATQAVLDHVATLQAQLESANVLIYKKNCALGRADTTITDLQAQLRQVEHDAETYRKMHTVCTMNLALANNELTTLRQLVEALPVVDVQEVSVWLSPDESGWLVSKRPAFPAGLYWAKFRTQDEADSFRALLAYRATLDAGQVSTSIIGKQVPPSQWDKNAGVRGDIS